MDDQQDGSSHARVYSTPEDEKQAERAEAPDPPGSPPRRKPLGWRVWLFVFPLVAWLACLGVAGTTVLPLIMNPQTNEIPVTGDDATQSPTQGAPSQAATPQADGKQRPGPEFANKAASQLEACSEAFRNYFLLEQLAIDNPDIFQNEDWRSDTTSAMHSFEDDCQTLGKLPAAPPAYAEVEHWLKLAASEVEPATASFSAALEKEQVGQFQNSIRHMIRFVDYIHNAESAMDSMRSRKEI